MEQECVSTAMIQRRENMRIPRKRKITCLYMCPSVFVLCSCYRMRLTSQSGCTSCSAWLIPVAGRDTSAEHIFKAVNNTKGMKEGFNLVLSVGGLRSLPKGH